MMPSMCLTKEPDVYYGLSRGEIHSAGVRVANASRQGLPGGVSVTGIISATCGDLVPGLSELAETCDHSPAELGMLRQVDLDLLPAPF